ncbi:MAG: hypothetical protein V2A73_14485 [Pseudomonadota bacterium]
MMDASPKFKRNQFVREYIERRHKEIATMSEEELAADCRPN